MHVATKPQIVLCTPIDEDDDLSAETADECICVRYVWGTYNTLANNNDIKRHGWRKAKYEVMKRKLKQRKLFRIDNQISESNSTPPYQTRKGRG